MWAAKKLNLLLPYEEQEDAPLEYTEKADDREMHQFTVAEGNFLIGRKLDACGFEEGGPILLMVKRGRQFLQPLPDLLLKKGDALNFLGERAAMLELHRRYFPQEEYTSALTFRELWNKLAKKYVSAQFKKLRKRR